MKFSTTRYILLSRAIIAVLVFGLSAEAQSGRQPSQRRPQDPRAEDTVKLRAEEVLLNVTVTDPYGHQATDLRKDEFIIAEDGRRQDLSSFLISSVPVNVVLMLDASGSVVPQIDSLRDAALKFVQQLRPEDKISVMEFHTNVELIQDWTSSAEELRHAISWRFKPGMVQTRNGSFDYGKTALYDSLYLASTDQLGKVEGRKILIILTDGDDTSSKVLFEQAVGAVVRAGAVIYVVSEARAQITSLNKYRSTSGKIFGGGTAQQAEYLISRLERAEELMTDLASRTGGRIFSPLKDEEMTDVYAQVARELKNQYIITYIPKNDKHDGRLRRINVYLTRAGYSARTRDSYYAPKE